jgi:hypothetical protein
LLLFRVDSRPVRQHRFGCGPAALWVSTLFAAAVGWQAQAADEPTVGLTVLNSMERISQHQAPFGKSAAELCAANNEVESFQVVVAALKERIRVVAAELSDLINRQYGITGLLYWSTVTTVIDPWFNPAFAHPRHYNGGGFLFYPGAPCGIDGPVASMRIKNLRDGMEDYEYFVLLEKRAGPQAVQKIVDRIAPNWWDYCRDPDAILAARREMAQQITASRGK